MCVYTVHTRWGAYGAGGDNYETDMYEEEQHGVRFWQLVPPALAHNPNVKPKYEEVFIPWQNVHSITKREGRPASLRPVG